MELTRCPGNGVDDALVAWRRLDSCERVNIPHLHGAVKGRRGQQVRVVRLELTVKDGLYVTLYNTVRPNKKETRFISEISSLPRKI